MLPDDENAMERSVLQALHEAGAATAIRIADELEVGDVSHVELALQRLEARGLVRFHLDLGRIYIPLKVPFSLTAGVPGPTIVHNDPDDMHQRAMDACSAHPEVPHARLDSVLSALVSGSRHHLQIISPFIDRQSVSRFIPEFDEAFSRGIEFTFVGRGILSREDTSRRDQYANKLDALKLLWDRYQAHNPGPPTRFSVRDYLRFQPPPDDRPLARGAIRATVHHKIVVQDGAWAYVGSGEFRHHSFGATGEAGVLVSGAHARMLSDLVQCYASRATPVDPDSIEELMHAGAVQ